MCIESVEWRSVAFALERLQRSDVRRMAGLDMGGNELLALPTQELALAILAASKRYDLEIDQSVANWSSEDRLPQCGRQATAWRVQRIRAADAFLIFLDPSELPESLFVCRKGVSMERAIKWMLTDWWYDQGVVSHATLLKAYGQIP